MKKQTTEKRDHQEVEKVGTMTVQLPLPLLSTLAEVEDGLFGLFVETGRQVLEVMMEQDRTALCGPKWVPNRGEGGRGSDSLEQLSPSDESEYRSHVPKAPIKIGKEKRMKDPYDEGIANRIGPESCVGDRKVAAKR